MASAVSTSTCAPSIAADRMCRGAGIGAPLICLRRFAGNAGRFIANAGVEGLPPGILKPLTSQGATAFGFSAIHARARLIISSGVSTASCASPTSTAARGLYRWPCSSTFSSASWIPSRRTTRVTPPAPGSRPRVTSGRPSSLPLTSSAIR